MNINHCVHGDFGLLQHHTSAVALTITVGSNRTGRFLAAFLALVND